MAGAPFGLTDKECEVLRLLSQGHDVKSAAAALGLSVHTINERLREARAKTRTTISRGAARLLAGEENHKFSVSTESVVTTSVDFTHQANQSRVGADRANLKSRLGVDMLISAVIAVIVVASAHFATDRTSGIVPRVISTTPPSGSMVDSGQVELSVTFDRPMQRQSYSFVQKNATTYPDCGSNRSFQSRDGRMFTMICRTAPHHTYEIWFNSPPYMNFKDEAGTAAMPYRLIFRTR